MKILNITNLPIFLSTLLLSAIGILVIYSSSHELAYQQLIFTGIGFVFLMIISRLGWELFKNFTGLLYVLVLILLLGVLILGIETRGSLRWIPLGIFNIQPSEFAKPVLILFLAKFWSEHLTSWLNICKSFLWVVPFFLLIFIQPDLGSALTIIIIWLGLLYAAGLQKKKILVLVLITILIIPTGWLFLHDYQKQRIFSFISPESDPLGKGYNVIQSTIAVGSGELFGRGLGRGTQSRLQFLPEFRTDFIFASIAEELGFIGAILILGFYIFLLTYLLRVVDKAKVRFASFIAAGVFFMLLFQVFVNIGMNIGVLPITGITLPLISYGGSSMIATLICLGLVASCARKS